MSPSATFKSAKLPLVATLAKPSTYSASNLLDASITSCLSSKAVDTAPDVIKLPLSALTVVSIPSTIVLPIASLANVVVPVKFLLPLIVWSSVVFIPLRAKYLTASPILSAAGVLYVPSACNTLYSAQPAVSILIYWSNARTAVDKSVAFLTPSILAEAKFISPIWPVLTLIASPALFKAPITVLFVPSKSP